MSNVLEMTETEFQEELATIRAERRAARLAELRAAEEDDGGMLWDDEVYEYYPPMPDWIEMRLKGEGA